MKIEATAKRNIKTFIWKKINQKESGTWHKLKVHSIKEEVTTRGRVKKGHSETADAGSRYIIVLQTYRISS
jgi:hypothetical protein